MHDLLMNLLKLQLPDALDTIMLAAHEPDGSPGIGFARYASRVLAAAQATKVRAIAAAHPLSVIRLTRTNTFWIRFAASELEADECALLLGVEGALNRVLAVADLCGHSLDRELVRMSLTDMSSPKHSTSADEIIESVSDVFGVPVEKVMSRDRTKDVALTRQVIMYLMREEANVSLPQIGLAMGGRDHTTVIHACEKVSSLLKTDNQFRSRVFRAKDMIFS